jgi:hypothetical protein
MPDPLVRRLLPLGGHAAHSSHVAPTYRHHTVYNPLVPTALVCTKAAAAFLPYLYGPLEPAGHNRHH